LCHTFNHLEKMAPHPMVVALATGMGLLLDKYLLQTGNVVDQFMTGQYNMDDAGTGPLFKASTLIGYPIGMALFGPLSDYIGRRACLIMTAVITCLGACGCTFAWSPAVIIFFRCITGIGAGGEYPLAACHVAESTGNRGLAAQNVGFLYVFGSGFGQAVCPLVAIILLAMFPTVPKDCHQDSHPAPDEADCSQTNNQIIWRSTFGVAAVLSLVCLVLRVLITKDAENFTRTKVRTPCRLVAKYWRPLASTALSWFFYDVVEYGLKNNDVSIFSKGSTVQRGLVASFESLTLSLPFLIFAALFVGKFATKYAQLLGFFALIWLNGAIATYDAASRADHQGLFKALYILQTGFQAFPGITTIATPADVFPSAVRGTCHGISAVCGKIGAIFGSYYFAYVKDNGEEFNNQPVQFIFILVTIACVCGFLVTIFLTPTYDGPALDAMDQHVLLDDHRSALACLYGKVTVPKEPSPEDPLTTAEGGVAVAPVKVMS
jgi:MFS family permease